MKKIRNLVYKMLTENTGSHMLDSGGVYGRAHEKNAKKTLQDFINEPEAKLEVSVWGDDGHIEASPTISLFHYLTKALSLDSVCDTFNRRKVADWNSEEFYGVSEKGGAWLLERFDSWADSFNSYNHHANFSQVVQGREIKCKNTGDLYVILQIHGGCDVRGGYTDAKLFKVECEYFLYESCSFDGVDWNSEFITEEGKCADNAFWELFKIKHNVTKDKPVTLLGSLYT